MGRREAVWVLGSALAACAPLDLSDDPVSFIDDGEYRRSILERDLVSTDNTYSSFRLANYGPGRSWDAMDASDPPTAPVTPAVLQALRDGTDPWAVADPERLSPADLPTDDAAWSALGRRVLFDYPIFPDPGTTDAARRGLLGELGVQFDGGRWIGVRLIDTESGPGIALTCAICHASLDEAGEPSAVLANREFDLGRLRLIRFLDEEGELPEDADLGELAFWADLPTGHSDVLHDEQFNPYAVPDFGGIAQLPYLHHTVNWFNTGVATLAIRIETVFMGRDTLAPQVDLELARIPRSLAWALAVYLRTLPAPAPTQPRAPAEVESGRRVFERDGCPACHTPPLFTSERLVGVDEIGTDPAAGVSPARGTGYYRIPSLRGVGRTAPYLHHGAFGSLEAMFDPERTEPGHRFGLQLGVGERAELLEFLRSI